MIQLTYKAMMEDSFVSAVRKLGNYNKFPAKTMYRVTKIIDKLQQESKHLNDTMQKLREKHGAKRLPGGGLQVPPENVEAFEKEVEALGETLVKVEQLKLGLYEVQEMAESHRLTPFELIAAKDLIDETQTERPAEAPALKAVSAPSA